LVVGQKTNNGRKRPTTAKRQKKTNNGKNLVVGQKTNNGKKWHL
jgi:hypothetical protein